MADARNIWDLHCARRAGAEVAAAAREAMAREEGQAGGELAGAGSKKRKGSSGQAVPVAPLEEESQATWAGHSQCVAAVAWPEEDRAVSGSWDHSVFPPFFPPIFPRHVYSTC